MYGFGDVPRPLTESVDLMNDIVHEYVQTMTTKAMKIAAKRGKLQIEDFFFVIRKDKKKYARAEELLRMAEEVKRAKKGMDIDGKGQN